MLDLEIMCSFYIFCLHFIMSLLDTCHDLMESFHKGLNLYWGGVGGDCITSQVDTKDLLGIEMGNVITWLVHTCPVVRK